MYLGVCELMQPMAVGCRLDKENFPRVHSWMERVKRETQPYFDQAHAILMRTKDMILFNETSKL